MINVAIVEDEEQQREETLAHFKKFEAEKHVSFDLKSFSNAVAFLNNYQPVYDIVVIDIRMPYMNGLDAAHYLRKLDEDVILIFATSLRQYAVNGYSVNALGYLVKPIAYNDFAMTIARALRSIKRKEKEETILLPTLEGSVRIVAEDIIYIETSGHQLIYHTQGKTYTRYAALHTAQKELEGRDFALCNRCYLVNLKYVQSVKGYTAFVNGEELQIGQPRKKEFMKALEKYSGAKK